MKTVSEVTGKMYENEDVVFYRNPAQSAFMISKGAKLIDIFVDSKMKFVFVFDRKDHDRITPLWINNKKTKESEDKNV
jgi:hypothetical protein